ncbi:MAG: hypothetical protein ABI655_04390 [Phenylobacterium sp.]
MPAPRSGPSVEMREKAQKLSELALATLAKIMEEGTQEALKLAAAREVLDRGFGRPKPGEPEAASQGLTVVVRRFAPPRPGDPEIPYDTAEEDYA